MEENTHHQEDYEDLIIRYLDGYATSAEQKTLRGWLGKSAANRETFEEMREIWQGAANAAVLTELDLDEDWEKVRGKLGSQGRLVRPNFRWRRMAAAASAALIILAGCLYWYLDHNTSGMRSMTLPDGSLVWLAPESRLDHPESFDPLKREVTLTGKAFFDVTHDPERPFVIVAGQGRIEVLGTSFNVIARKDSTEVIVNQGKVRLSEIAEPSNRVTLVRNEKGILKNNNLLKAPNDNPNYQSWKTNVLVFDGVPVEKALLQISAHYGRTLTLDTSGEVDCMLSATFENEDLKDVIEVIENSCQSQVRQTAD